jgi:hypothetical protein
MCQMEFVVVFSNLKLIFCKPVEFAVKFIVVVFSNLKLIFCKPLEFAVKFILKRLLSTTLRVLDNLKVI